MKRLMMVLVFIVTVILVSVLYATHGLVIEEKAAVSLEQAYKVQYPTEIPDLMTVPTTHFTF